MMLNKLLIVGVALALAGSAQAKGNAAAGKAKAGTCVGCHGPKGNSANPAWPKLAGQGEAYIAKQLADFKSG
ncbi:MAG: c-type cytochrome, partial [Gammaproteobacteria bacterium]|nr:c-type cytochrome [Gammaproteobacteria bacterium]